MRPRQESLDKCCDRSSGIVAAKTIDATILLVRGVRVARVGCCGTYRVDMRVEHQRFTLGVVAVGVCKDVVVQTFGLDSAFAQSLLDKVGNKPLVA